MMSNCIVNLIMTREWISGKPWVLLLSLAGLRTLSRLPKRHVIFSGTTNGQHLREILSRHHLGHLEGEVSISLLVLEHPFGVVVLDDGRLGRGQRRVELDRLRQVLNTDVHVKSFYCPLPG